MSEPNLTYLVERQMLNDPPSTKNIVPLIRRKPAVSAAALATAMMAMLGAGRDKMVHRHFKRPRRSKSNKYRMCECGSRLTWAECCGNPNKGPTP